VTDAIVALIEGALNSPWGLVALAALAAVDGFFPVVPSESLVVTADVFAAAGGQSLTLVIAAAALGGAGRRRAEGQAPARFAGKTDCIDAQGPCFRTAISSRRSGCPTALWRRACR
jgi:hypothetical protein